MGFYAAFAPIIEERIRKIGIEKVRAILQLRNLKEVAKVESGSH